MNKIVALTTVTLIALGLGSAGTNAKLKGNTMNNQEQIRSLLDRYETALNESDVDAAVALYADDGIFMPTNAPTAAGTTAVRGAYEHVFGMTKLDIAFSIDEILALKVFLTLFLPAGALLYVQIIPPPVIPAAALFGFFFTELWLNDQASVRRKKITKDLPFVLDLLTLSVEAGLESLEVVRIVDLCEGGHRGMYMALAEVAA